MFPLRSRRCYYCTVDYDVIGHMETFREDLAFILHTAGVARHEIDLMLGEKKNQCDRQQDKAKIYMGQLNQEQKEGLYEIYKPDFEMFGYSADL